MRHLTPKAMCAAAVLTVAAGAADAQPRLTLADAIRESLAHNASLRAGRSTVDEAQAHIDEARAGWWPRVTVSELWQRGNQPVFVFSSLLSARQFTGTNLAIDALNHPDPIGAFRTSFGVEQLLFDGGRRRATVAMARLRHDVAGFALDETTAALLIQTTETYGRVLTAESGQRAAIAARDAMRQDRVRAEQRRDAGVATEADVLALAAHVANLDQRVLQLEADAAVARAELNRLVGAEIDRQYAIAEPMAPRRPAVGELRTLLADAEANRVELKRSTAAIRLAGADARRERAVLLPQVAVQGVVDVSGTQVGARASNWVVGGEARWSLSLGGAEAARLRAAKARQTQAQAHADDVRAAVHVEVATAFYQRRSAEARQVAGRAAVDQARESERVLRDRFEAGLASVTDVLTASSAVLAAETQQLSAAVDLLMSDARLWRAVGRVVPIQEAVQ